MKQIETLTPQKAAEVLRELGMHISATTIRLGISQGVFSFGDAIESEGQTIFYIYKPHFQKWIAERLSTGSDNNEAWSAEPTLAENNI